jgi:hypothetical protein
VESVTPAASGALLFSPAVLAALPELGRPRRRAPGRIAALLAVALLAGVGAGAQVTQGGALPEVPLFPPDNWWNVDISQAPVDANSATYIGWIGTSRGMHPDFGGDVDPTNPGSTAIYGMPYAVVPGNQPLETVTFVSSPDQSDNGAPGHPLGYPIPVAARTQGKWIEGGTPGGCNDSDCHMLIVDRDNRILYELYQAHWNVNLSRWEAGSGAIFVLDSDGRRPDTWTSADAAGLAILPGLVRYDEAFASAPIRHAFRFTLRDSNGYVYPGSHVAGSNPAAPPLGTRLRLKATVDLSGYTAEVQKIFQAMKTYGLLLADNGSDMYVQGTYDTRWNNDVLNPAFAALTASDFDVIELGWKPAVATSTGPLSFYTLAPCRLLDTRAAPGLLGAPAIPPNTQRILTAASQCGVPAAARALSLNLTVVNTAGSGYLSLFAGDAGPPLASVLNFTPGTTRANNALVMLASSGTCSFGIQHATPSNTPVQVVADVNGYFQ